jgi:hypothetical protein
MATLLPSWCASSSGCTQTPGGGPGARQMRRVFGLDASSLSLDTTRGR